MSERSTFDMAKDLEAGAYTPFEFRAAKKPAFRKYTSIVLSLLLVGALVKLVHTPAALTACTAILAVFAPAPVAPVVNVFEVATPVAVPVGAVSSVLVNNTELVDGLSASYDAPKTFNYTNAVLSLNLTLDAAAAQESGPVVEISVGHSPVWRFAVPDAQVGSSVFASTVKDISEYLSLFESDEKITFSVLEGGAPVNASLELAFYTAAAKPVVPGVEAIFAAEGPASSVFPLQKSPVELPGSFAVSLPQVASNVTAAKISVFASATKDEIEFYKSDIAGLAEPVTANGPARQFNVFIGDVFVGSFAPKPVLFHADNIATGGEKLWTPVVDSGSLTGLSYDIDLVSVLPLLWEGPQDLEIVVVSPIDAANKVAGVPATAHPVLSESNLISGSWLVSGNLLTWESALVSKSVGAVLLSNSSQTDSGSLVEPPAVTPWQPKIKTEKITSDLTSSVVSQFNFTLADNTTASYSVVSNYTMSYIQSKQERSSKTPVGPPGSGAEISKDFSTQFSIRKSELDLAVTDALTGVAVLTKSTKSAFPFTLTGTTETGPAAAAAKNKLSISVGSDIKTKVNALTTSSLKIDEKLSLDDVVGTSSDFKLKASAGGIPFSRQVKVANGKVISDL